MLSVQDLLWRTRVIRTTDIETNRHDYREVFFLSLYLLGGAIGTKPRPDDGISENQGQPVKFDISL